MTLLLIASIVLFIGGIILASNYEDICSFLGSLCTVIGAVGLIIVVCIGFFWVGAKYQADIINAEFGTNYSREQVFYASSVIDEIRQLDRKRIELNGDLLRDK